MTKLPPGPWNKEPELQTWTDERTGYRCAIVRHPRIGHLCGYVVVPDTHPLAGKQYDHRVPVEDRSSIEIDTSTVGVFPLFFESVHEDDGRVGLDVIAPAHQGLTYSDEPYWDGAPDGWAFGFDCAHFGDRTASVSLEGETYRSSDYVRPIVTQLATFLFAIAGELND